MEMSALILMLLLNPIDQVATVGDNEEVTVLKVDRTPDVAVVGPDACADSKSQPSLSPPRIGEIADGWPNEMEVEGVVVGLIPGYCGFACSPGSFHIRVTQGPADVRDRDLYVATSCVFREEVRRYCGKAVRLKVRKLLRDSTLCGVDEAMPFFATSGIPYYTVDDSRTVTILASSPNNVWPQPQRLTTRSSALPRHGACDAQAPRRGARALPRTLVGLFD